MDDASFQHDVLHGNHNDAIEAIEAELGTNPSGSFPTVLARLQSSLFYAGYDSPQSLLVGPAYMNTWFPATGGTPNSQDVLYVRWYCPESFTATKLWWLQNTAASAITSASMGIFNSSGTLLQSASIAGAVTTSGLKSVTITSQAVTAGSVYYLAYTVNGTTGQVAAASGTSNSLALTGASASDRLSYNQAGQASMPSSVTFSGLSMDLRVYAFGIST